MPTNVEVLAYFIAHNPGCTPAQARRALCEWKGKKYHRGYYCWYFARGHQYTGPKGMDYGYWENRDGYLYITEKGHTKLV
jgi:hypothetical protein